MVVILIFLILNLILKSSGFHLNNLIKRLFKNLLLNYLNKSISFFIAFYPSTWKFIFTFIWSKRLFLLVIKFRKIMWRISVVSGFESSDYYFTLHLKKSLFSPKAWWFNFHFDAGHHVAYFEIFQFSFLILINFNN